MHPEDLIQNARKCLGPVTSTMHLGRINNENQQFPALLAQQEKLSRNPDGLFCLDDSIVVLPTLRLVILQNLISDYLGKGQDKVDDMDHVLIDRMKCAHY